MTNPHLTLPFSREKLRELRERKGLGRTELINRCADLGRKVTTQHIGRIERGECLPSAPLLKTLADALDAEIDDLLYQAGAA